MSANHNDNLALQTGNWGSFIFPSNSQPNEQPSNIHKFKTNDSNNNLPSIERPLAVEESSPFQCSGPIDKACLKREKSNLNH